MKTNYKQFAIILSFALLVSSQVAVAGGNRIRLDCGANGAADFSMDARYEQRRNREKFDASFEAAPNAGFAAGEELDVKVGGVSVGTMTLVALAGGDVTGDIEFDTQADENNPFPVNFPEVAEGVSVMVGDLGCALQ